jgi:hypothetical protein
LKWIPFSPSKILHDVLIGVDFGSVLKRRSIPGQRMLVSTMDADRVGFEDCLLDFCKVAQLVRRSVDVGPETVYFSLLLMRMSDCISRADVMRLHH